MTPLQKLPKNVRDLGKIIVAKGFKKLPKVQKIAQSGHTDHDNVVKGLSRTIIGSNKCVVFKCTLSSDPYIRYKTEKALYDTAMTTLHYHRHF